MSPSDPKSSETTPRGYVTGAYLDYQKKYATQMRESDRALLRLIEQSISADLESGRSLDLLDIGCSTGNFLIHLGRHLPALRRTGADLFPEIIADCRVNPDLAEVAFEVMDLRTLGDTPRFDVVVANAVMGRFDNSTFATILAGLGRILRPGGHLFAFDWYHPYEQSLAITEVSQWHPEGLVLNMRPYSVTRTALADAGFADVSFTPFEIPIDLSEPVAPDDIRTYTKRAEDGRRFQFRGALFQPWCHVHARRA